MKSIVSQALSHRWTWSCFPDQMHREMVMSKTNDWLDLIHVCGSQDRNTLTHTYCYCARTYSHSIFITKESVCFGCFCLSPGNLSNISVFRALLATLYLDTSIDRWACVNWTVSKPTGSYARDENRSLTEHHWSLLMIDQCFLLCSIFLWSVSRCSLTAVYYFSFLCTQFNLFGCDGFFKALRLLSSFQKQSNITSSNAAQYIRQLSVNTQLNSWFIIIFE